MKMMMIGHMNSLSDEQYRMLMMCQMNSMNTDQMRMMWQWMGLDMAMLNHMNNEQIKLMMMNMDIHQMNSMRTKLINNIDLTWMQHMNMDCWHYHGMSPLVYRDKYVSGFFPADKPVTTSDKDELDDGEIAGIVIGSIAGLCILLVILAIIWRWCCNWTMVRRDGMGMGMEMPYNPAMDHTNASGLNTSM